MVYTIDIPDEVLQILEYWRNLDFTDRAEAIQYIILNSRWTDRVRDQQITVSLKELNTVADWRKREVIKIKRPQ